MPSNLLAQLAGALSSGAVRVVDLSQPLGPDTPVIALPPMFGQSLPFSSELISHYDDRGPAWAWSNITLGEHTGTHFDAPVHWVSGKDQPNNALDTIGAERLVAPACVLDFSAECAADPDFLLTPEHIQAWEAKHGRIEAGSWVLLRSGWGQREGDAFLNMSEDGSHTPGPSPDAVRFLVEQRDAIGFGTECVGTDAGQAHGFTPPFPSHTMMHGANKFGLASLTNLDQLPPKGAILITPPLKIVGGTGSPCRVLALVEG
ncbi:cyclase family protein [Roseomonas sp. BN140053]|uniref:cyclase family protein n=1 Tax=Roseomonas sp. BN140053 TaxID=3391898 RepID=UPI0039E805C1